MDASVLYEVQEEGRDQEPPAGQDEERKAGNQGGMPQLRDQGISNR